MVVDIKFGGSGPTSPTPNTRRVYVKSFGCQMNVYDSNRMVDMLAPEGFIEENQPDNADLIILNTCHIREQASEKIFSELGKMRVIKDERAKAGQRTAIAVAGCVAQAEGQEILRRQKAVDLVIGPQAYHRLPALLKEAALKQRGVVDTEFPLEDKFLTLENPTADKVRSRGVTSFVTVQEGCDKFCSFCVVPYTRGAESSRPVSQIISEVQVLAASGVREITLLGQNVNAYHGLDPNGVPSSLASLFAAIAAVPGITRLRYMTSHPNDMDQALIDAHRDLTQLMPFLHLPVQSGSDRILHLMNRKHTAADYLDLISRVRQARPDIALSSDFIVGFPGETETDFEATLNLIHAVGFASVFSFKYSQRPGTPGVNLPDQVPEDVSRARLAKLQSVVDAQRQAFNATMVGKTVEVLFEKPGRYPGQIGGKTPYLQAVHVEGPISMIGSVAPVQILSQEPNSLVGRLLA